MLKKDDLWFAAKADGQFLLNNGASHVYSMGNNLIAFKSQGAWGILNHESENYNASLCR